MVRFDLEESNSKQIAGVANDAQRKKKHAEEGFSENKFFEFCQRTDLHGYKYIVMEDFTSMERVGWAFAVLLSIAVAVFFVVTAYRWFARNPIVTVIESTQTAIWDVPFPAVTICDLNMVSRKAAKKMAANMLLPKNVTTDFVFETLRYVPLLYSTFKADAEEKERLYQLQTILDFNNITMQYLFKNLSPSSSCNHLVQKCMWKNALHRCDELFGQVFTLLGLCCTFNYFAIRDKRTEESIPRRVASCGYQTALSVLLYTDPMDYYSATVASQGILVAVDNAHNIPDLDSPVRMVNPSTEVLIALSPERTYTTPGIKYFNPEDRMCYYTEEVEIGKFLQYSFHNCMAYQKVQQMKYYCNCVPLYYPFEENYRICNFKDMDCLENVFMLETYSSNNGSNNTKPYKCLPECEHYDYPLEVALGKLADAVHINGLPFFDDVGLVNRSLLNVFFNDLVSTRYRRDVYLNWQNVLAAFGGLLSLMLGFTLISGFDLVLFFICRLACKSYIDLICDNNTQNKINVQDYQQESDWLPHVNTQKKAFVIVRNNYYDQDKY